MYKHGIDFKNISMNDETNCNICPVCYASLKKKKPTIPQFSPANNCFIGDVPPELQNLTIPEEQLIALYRHNKFIVKIHSKTYDSSKQTKIRGNVIVFQQYVGNIANVLPLSDGTLCDNIKIIFVGSNVPDRVQTKRLLKVRREKVHNALKWLVIHNPLYKNIKISRENISKLPVDDVPNSLWDTVDCVLDSEAADSVRANYCNENRFDLNEKDMDVLDSETNVINSKDNEQLNENSEVIFSINSSAVVDVDCTDLSFSDVNKYLFETVLKNHETKTNSDNKHTDRSYYIIPRGEEPVSQFGNSKLLIGLFPTLFPFGVGSPDDLNRQYKTSYKQHIQYLLSYFDKRFERHPSFIYVVFNILQRRNACYKAKLMMKQPYSYNYAKLISKIKSKDVEEALKLIANKGKELVEINESVQRLVKQIKTVAGNIPGSAQSRSLLRNNIHAMIYCKGLPSIFITINPADTKSPIALYFAGVHLNLESIIKETFPDAYERSQIIVSNPVAVAKYFNYLIEAILSTLIMGGILGPTDSYFGTVESQGRGSLHLHMLIWLAHKLKPLDINALIHDPEFRRNLLSYLEDIIKESLDDYKELNLNNQNNNGSEILTKEETIISHGGLIKCFYNRVNTVNLFFFFR